MSPRLLWLYLFSGQLSECGMVMGVQSNGIKLFDCGDSGQMAIDKLVSQGSGRY